MSEVIPQIEADPLVLKSPFELAKMLRQAAIEASADPGRRWRLNVQADCWLELLPQLPTAPKVYGKLSDVPADIFVAP